MSEPITREEMYLAALGGEVVTPPAPITRMDMYLAYLNGMTDTYPEPITRIEQYLYKLCQNGMGGGGSVTIRNQNKTITKNGEYTHDAGYTGLGVVTVNVEASGGGEYTAEEIKTMRILSRLESGFLDLDVFGYTSIDTFFSGSNTCITGLYWSSSSNAPTSIGQSAFQNCTNLETVDFPNIKYWHYASVFSGCTNLKSVNIPEFNSILQSSTFANCKALEKIDLPLVTALGGTVFNGCSALKTVILRNSKVCELKNVNNFNDTPFVSGGTGGTVYVPSALISEYRAATNWSTLYAAGTCNFVAIEGSEYE